VLENLVLWTRPGSSVLFWREGRRNRAAANPAADSPLGRLWSGVAMRLRTERGPFGDKTSHRRDSCHAFLCAKKVVWVSMLLGVPPPPAPDREHAQQTRMWPREQAQVCCSGKDGGWRDSKRSIDPRLFALETSQVTNARARRVFRCSRTFDPVQLGSNSCWPLFLANGHRHEVVVMGSRMRRTGARHNGILRSRVAKKKQVTKVRCVLPRACASFSLTTSVRAIPSHLSMVLTLAAFAFVRRDVSSVYSLTVDTSPSW